MEDPACRPLTHVLGSFPPSLQEFPDFFCDHSDSPCRRGALLQQSFCFAPRARPSLAASGPGPKSNLKVSGREKAFCRLYTPPRERMTATVDTARASQSASPSGHLGEFARASAPAEAPSRLSNRLAGDSLNGPSEAGCSAHCLRLSCSPERMMQCLPIAGRLIGVHQKL
jgi:hypothetical protein